MIFNNILINLNESFSVDDDKVLFNEFLSAFDKNLDVKKFQLNYGAIEEIFEVNLNKDKNFYMEFRKKVLRLDKSLYKKYQELKDKIQTQLDNIENIINKLKFQIEKLEDKKITINTEIDLLDSIIGTKKWRGEEHNEELNKSKEYKVQICPSIDFKIKKCKQYIIYLNKEKEDINKEWNEKNIKKYSLTEKSIENIFTNCSSELFDAETDYNVNVKVNIHTRKLMQEINKKITYLPKDMINEYILKERKKNKYSTEILELLYLNDKEEYYRLLKEYMKEENIIEFIVNATKENYFLAHRSEVIENIIMLYRNSNYQTCICLIPLQIEGMLYDYCEELEIVPKDLSNFSIGTKITEIDKVVDFYLSDYINYNIHIIRNKIAHGLLYEEDKENTCIELILDLATLIYILNSEKKIYSNELKEFLIYYKNKDEIDYFSSCFKINNEFTKIKRYIFNDEIADKRKCLVRGRINLLFSTRGRMIAKHYDCLNDLLEVTDIMISESFLKYYKENEINKLSKNSEKIRIDKNRAFISALLRKNLGEIERDILVECNKKIKAVKDEKLKKRNKANKKKEIIIENIKNNLMSYSSNN